MIGTKHQNTCYFFAFLFLALPVLSNSLTIDVTNLKPESYSLFTGSNIETGPTVQISYKVTTSPATPATCSIYVQKGWQESHDYENVTGYELKDTATVNSGTTRRYAAKYENGFWYDWYVKCTAGGVTKTTNSQFFDTTSIKDLKPADDAEFAKPTVATTYKATSKNGGVINCSIHQRNSYLNDDYKVVDNALVASGTKRTYVKSYPDWSDIEWYVSCKTPGGAYDETTVRTFSLDHGIKIDVFTPPSFQDSAVTISYEAESDATSSPDLRCDLYINNNKVESATVSDDETHDYETTLAPGVYDYYVYCKYPNNANPSREGLSETGTFEVEKPLTVTAKNPLNNAVVPNPVSMSFAASSNTGSDMDCSLYIDNVKKYGTGLVSNPGAMPVAPITLSAGAHSWYVQCVSEDGYSAKSETWQFTASEQPKSTPSLSVRPQSPSNGFVSTIQSVELVYIVTTNSTSAPLCTTFVNNAPYASIYGKGAKSVSFMTETSGAYVWYTSCSVDGAQATGASRNFTVNLQPANPAMLSIASPANNSVLTKPNVNLSYYLAGGTSAICDLYVNSEVKDSRQATGYVTFVAALQNGVYDWYVSCTNAGGKSTSPTYKFTVNAPVPRVSASLDMPANGYNSTLANVTLGYRAFVINADAPAPVYATCTVYVNGQEKDTRQALGTTLFNSEYANGSYVWYVTCTYGSASNTTPSRNFAVNAPNSQIQPKAPTQPSPQQTNQNPQLTNIQNGETQQPAVQPGSVAVRLLNPAKQTFTQSLVRLAYVPTSTDGSDFKCKVFINSQEQILGASTVKSGQKAEFSTSYNNGAYSWYVECKNSQGASGTSRTNQFIVNVPIPAEIDIRDGEIELLAPENNYESKATSIVDIGFVPYTKYAGKISCYLYVNGALVKEIKSDPNSKVFYSASYKPGSDYTWNVICKAGELKFESEKRGFTVSEFAVIQDSKEFELASGPAQAFNQLFGFATLSSSKNNDGTAIVAVGVIVLILLVLLFYKFSKTQGKVGSPPSLKSTHDSDKIAPKQNKKSKKAKARRR
ncbi:hypothetical protein FJZ26_04965 [Candidatus Parvarchaeota archaeon]|nr:hypothetical protein [Candidatus Parvarchaeota archaeon]